MASVALADLPAPEVVYYVETDNYGDIIRWGGNWDWGISMEIGDHIPMCAGFYDLAEYPDANYTLDLINYDTGEVINTTFTPDNLPYAVDDFYYCFDSGAVSAFNHSVRVTATNEGETGTGYAPLFNVVPATICEASQEFPLVLTLILGLIPVMILVMIVMIIIRGQN